MASWVEIAPCGWSHLRHLKSIFLTLTSVSFHPQTSDYRHRWRCCSITLIAPDILLLSVKNFLHMPKWSYNFFIMQMRLLTFERLGQTFATWQLSVCNNNNALEIRLNEAIWHKTFVHLWFVWSHNHWWLESTSRKRSLHWLCWQRIVVLAVEHRGAVCNHNLWVASSHKWAEFRLF